MKETEAQLARGRQALLDEAWTTAKRCLSHVVASGGVSDDAEVRMLLARSRPMADDPTQ